MRKINLKSAKRLIFLYSLRFAFAKINEWGGGDIRLWRIKYIESVNRIIDNTLKIMREVTSEGNNLFYKIVDFPLKLIAVLGVFAGFGFTAIAFVKNIWLFILGEFLFVIAVISGLYWYKKIIIGHIKVYKKYTKNLSGYIKELEKIRVDVANGKINSEKFKEKMLEVQNKSADIFKERPKANDIILSLVLWIFGFASIFLLLSFLPLNYQKLFHHFVSIICFCQN